jgi:hypothetical protein
VPNTLTTQQFPSDQAIDRFWAWFKENAISLKDLRPESVRWSELDRQLAAIGVDGWEIGPESIQQGDLFFALSTKGDRNIFRINQRIVARAPSIGGWKFLPAKPRKHWDRRFLWSTRTLDASNWKFILYSYDDGMYDLALLGDVLGEFSDVEKRRILAFVVESELGEGISLERICGLEFNDRPTLSEETQSIEISRLFDYLGSHRLQ